MKATAFLGGYRIYHERFGKLFPNSNPHHVIMLLAYSYNDPPSQDELANLLGVSQATVSRMASVLVSNLLACWAPVKHSGKKGSAPLALTDAGRNAIEQFEGELEGVRGGSSLLSAGGQQRLKDLRVEKPKKADGVFIESVPCETGTIKFS